MARVTKSQIQGYFEYYKPIRGFSLKEAKSVQQYIFDETFQKGEAKKFKKFKEQA